MMWKSLKASEFETIILLNNSIREAADLDHKAADLLNNSFVYYDEHIWTTKRFWEQRR